MAWADYICFEELLQVCTSYKVSLCPDTLASLRKSVLDSITIPHLTNWSLKVTHRVC